MKRLSQAKSFTGDFLLHLSMGKRLGVVFPIVILIWLLVWWSV